MLPQLVVALGVSAAVVANPARVVRRQDASATSTPVTTAVASPTAALSSKLPAQAALPPKQDWCPSEIFCAGSVLQTLNLAQAYPDSKTIVDKPTKGSAQKTVDDFNAFGKNTNDITFQQVVDFLNNDFQGEGRELEALKLDDFVQSPKFLDGVSDPVIKAFSQTVHGYWNNLIRGTNESTLCNGSDCESSLIPLNHTFVVPGGRFREIYYWDSYFVEQGLLASGLFSVVNSTLQNFMDQLEQFGFIPNGGRIYYLNRSQPPFFIPMLHAYVNATGDKDILKRALPLAEKEFDWWKTNRTITVTSPYSNEQRQIVHYAVVNSAPRPESYLPDYQTANGADLTTQFTDSEKADIYSELASGAETGWDYSSRWMRQPFLGNASFSFPALRTLNVRETIPVDLNSILYKAHVDLADLYEQNNDNDNAGKHKDAAATLKTAIIELFWDKDKLAFYDFNATANARATQLTAAHFYPLWAGIHPPELLKDSNSAFSAFASLNLVLNRYNGTFPATFLTTGQQWDAPNAWPPHQFIVLQALKNLPSNITGGAVPKPSNGANSFSLIPSGQLGIGEGDLPVQTLAGGSNASQDDLSAQDGTVFNGGDARQGEGWAAALERQLANRYATSVFCSWHATGGSLNGLVDRLPDDQLNVTQSTGLQGQMFEKFSLVDIDSAGRGGEYTVQAGFGWTNGVLLYVAQNYGNVLKAPSCPPVLAVDGSGSGSGNGDGTGAAASLRVPSLLALFTAVVFALFA
ncbi:glycoside hydrolase family 37 protein [Exidia glandulosa HHB12029]|uniref:Trehalase n=1 Tax=Exidia glandulosa HHB12029 TaxID=1314781 RepID=A0A166AZF3_EXIGL|nr:glycoside hydrolase family 37 protein [Exidia glandulosa HHB12029]